MVEDERLSPADRLLLVMHNLGVVHERTGKPLQELVQLTKLSLDQLREILGRHEEAGYVSRITDPQGAPRYFLTGRGIIRVSSVFT
jgi:hypothetical protein